MNKSPMQCLELVSTGHIVLLIRDTSASLSWVSWDLRELSMMTLGPKASAGVTAFVILALATSRENDDHWVFNILSLYILLLKVCSWLAGWV